MKKILMSVASLAFVLSAGVDAKTCKSTQCKTSSGSCQTFNKQKTSSSTGATYYYLNNGGNCVRKTGTMPTTAAPATRPSTAPAASTDCIYSGKKKDPSKSYTDKTGTFPSGKYHYGLVGSVCKKLDGRAGAAPAPTPVAAPTTGTRSAPVQPVTPAAPAGSVAVNVRNALAGLPGVTQGMANDISDTVQAASPSKCVGAVAQQMSTLTGGAAGRPSVLMGRAARACGS